MTYFRGFALQRHAPLFRGVPRRSSAPRVFRLPVCPVCRAPLPHETAQPCEPASASATNRHDRVRSADQTRDHASCGLSGVFGGAR